MARRVWMLAMMAAMGFGAVAAELRVEENTLRVTHDGGTLAVSLHCPRLAFEGMDAVGGGTPVAVSGGPEMSERLEAHYAPLPGGVKVVLVLQWLEKEGVLRKWAEVTLAEDAEPHVLAEVTLEELPAAGLREAIVSGPPQSYPAYLKGFFVGVEYPVASTRVEGDRLLVGHRPGLRLEPGKTYTTRKAVYGCAPEGREKAAFQQYVVRHRPGKPGLHVNYNSWWTSSVPFSEAEILGLMKTFEEKLYKPYGVPLDTFTIDMGWSNKQSPWEINAAMFPQGFGPIQQAAERMGARLGLWISPSSCYPDALDPEWAAAEGYETFTTAGVNRTVRYCCLGGERYATVFRERLVEMVTKYGVRHVKLDGYALQCPEAGHGHAPGALSSEAVAEGGIRAFAAAREAAPEVWLEATCFGWNPSPWWLFHVNSVIGTFGDDAPHGRVPAPVYRESYTTARDFFNLQGAAWLQAPVPAQEVLGVIHQTPDPFLNDAVVTFLRGHEFVPLYVNPKYMDEGRWKMLADLIRWTREHPEVYALTEPVLPASWQGGKAPQFVNDAPMPREPYGYAHWGSDRGLVVLRNPWIAPATATLRVPSGEGLSAVSLYPEARVYGRDLGEGSELAVPLAPYETVVLAIEAGKDANGLPEVQGRIGSQVDVKDARQRVQRVRFEDAAERLGADWTVVTAPDSAAVALEANAKVTVAAPKRRLLVLLEGSKALSLPVHALCRINGAEAALIPGSTDAGWAASSIPAGAERWMFLETELPEGECDVALELVADCERVSVWATAGRMGRADAGPLPAPERMWLDAKALVEPADVGDAVAQTRPAVVERIDGVFLDTLEPASVAQGYGTLQTNRSVTEAPLAVGSRTFRRGLGTHAVSRIAYDLDGSYGRFAAWVGVQRGYYGTVNFEVWVDGRKAWESGLMGEGDPAKPVEVDVRGAKRLELVVGDGGNGIGADHGDWGEARLLR